MAVNFYYAKPFVASILELLLRQVFLDKVHF